MIEAPLFASPVVYASVLGAVLAGYFKLRGESKYVLESIDHSADLLEKISASILGELEKQLLPQLSRTDSVNISTLFGSEGEPIINAESFTVAGGERVRNALDDFLGAKLQVMLDYRHVALIRSRLEGLKDQLGSWLLCISVITGIESLMYFCGHLWGHFNIATEIHWIAFGVLIICISSVIVYLGLIDFNIRRLSPYRRKYREL